MPKISAILSQGQRAQESGDVAEAARMWQAALDGAGRDTRTLLDIVRFHVRYGRRGEVSRAYRSLVAVSPDLAEAAPFDPQAVGYLERIKSGIFAFWRCVTRPEPSLGDDLARGQLMKLIGNFGAAERAFRLAEARSPKGDTRAALQIQLLRPWEDGATLPSSAEALRVFAAAWYKDLMSEDHRRLGGLNGQITLGRINKMHKPLKALVSDLLIYEGTLLMRLHFLYEVGRNYCAAAGISVDYPVWMVRIREALEGREPLQDAKSIFLAVIQLEPNSVFAWHNLGLVEFALGQLKEAEQHLQKAVKINAGLKPFAQLRLAEIAERSGDFATAANLYQEATAVFGEIGAYHRNAGRCLWALGRTEEAALHYEKAMHWNRWQGPEFSINPLSVPPEDSDPSGIFSGHFQS